MGLGDYPLQYNPSIHGPYDPGRYYGKRDTPLGQVKLNELPAWLLRRNYNPRAMIQAISRGYWRWSHKYTHPLKSGLTPYLQLITACSILSYCLFFNRIKHHRQSKYHW